MQRGRRGLVPTRSATIRDENGNPCTTTDTQHQRWRRHFSNVLNIPSQFNEVELARIRQRPIKSQMADLPTMEELIKAVGKLKTGKAGGSSGILPEMVKAACSDSDFLELLLSFAYIKHGRRDKYPRSGQMPSSCPSPRKETSPNATAGGALLC